jgi:hypothetical protein
MSYKNINEWLAVQVVKDFRGLAIWAVMTLDCYDFELLAISGVSRSNRRFSLLCRLARIRLATLHL